MNAVMKFSGLARSVLGHDALARTPARSSSPSTVFKPRHQISAELIPRNRDDATIEVSGRTVILRDLRSPIWRNPTISKGDLLRYYVRIAPVILPHLRDRAVVLRRYPDGFQGASVTMQSAPGSLPEWVALCSIQTPANRIVDFVMIHDVPSLLWTINLGCIDLHQWHAPCDAVDRPDALMFALDPGAGAPFAQVCETALIVREALAAVGLVAYVKTSGTGGLHLRAPIARGPTQRQIWRLAKEMASSLAGVHNDLMTVERRLGMPAARRVLVDYEQNSWRHLFVTPYSVRPRPHATVSAPLTWGEVERGCRGDDFRIDTLPHRIKKVGDPWEPLLNRRNRFRLDKLL